MICSLDDFSSVVVWSVVISAVILIVTDEVKYWKRWNDQTANCLITVTVDC